MSRSEPGHPAVRTGAPKKRRDPTLEAHTLPAELVAEAIQFSQAENTTRLYRAQWRFFADWCEASGHESLPADPEHVAEYLAMLGEFLKVGSVRSVLAAINAAHRTAGFEQPRKSELVNRTMRGLTRKAASEGETVDQATPLTEEMLTAIEETASIPRAGRGGRPETAEHAEKRGAVDVVLARLLATGLRVSEAVAVTYGDVDVGRKGVGTLSVRRSKTDQTGEGAVVALTRKTVAAVQRLQELTEAPENEPMVDMTTRNALKRIKKAAEVAGFEGITTHSGRVGLAQRMVAAGAPTAVVQRQGRWKSPEMVSSYTRHLDAEEALKWME